MKCALFKIPPAPLYLYKGEYDCPYTADAFGQDIAYKTTVLPLVKVYGLVT